MARLLKLASVVLTLAAGTGVLAQPIRDEYAFIGYHESAVDNRIARLEKKLASGEVTLESRGNRGYLDSLLAALEIDPHSQTLIFSKTSLQYPLISAKTPRAIYFNDDTYIGWVQNSTIIEVMTVDAKVGTTFHVFNNIPDTLSDNKKPIESHAQRCLVCHDSTGATGGGVPLVLARSSLYSINDINLRDVSGVGNVTDKTPVSERWGGWYVTGLHGDQTHLGNIQLQGPEDLPRVNELLRGNLSTLEGLFDTTPYPTPTSDIVALMVLEHQLAIQNQLGYVKFKAPAVLSRTRFASGDGGISAASWADLPAAGQRALGKMLDELVSLLLFKDAATFTAPIEGSPEYKSSFLASGPRDGAGRSLRDFDLQTRLFRYRLSYLVYSEAFDALPPYASDYVYQKLAAILEGRDSDPRFAYLTERERQDVLAILRDTKPAILPYLAPPGG
ncbi:MAG: hypothetical protein V4603_13380 [Pseudomonadota bacterium]